MTLFLDCSSGISGDMFSAALLDLGAPGDFLESELSKLDLDFGLATSRVLRSGREATRFEVSCKEEKDHRFLSDILSLIDDSRLSDNVKSMASRIFYELGGAESKVHNCGIDEVFFHEVGAVDSIVDVVSACVLLDRLGESGFFINPVAVGSGRLDICGHGQVSLPAPATRVLLSGLPVRKTNVPFELSTPTGAALVRVFSRGVYDLPPRGSWGLGAGMRDLENPNVLGALLKT